MFFLLNCAPGPRDVWHRLLPRRQRQGQRRPPRDRRPRHQLLQRRGQVQPQGLLPLVRDRQDQRHQDGVYREYNEHSIVFGAATVAQGDTSRQVLGSVAISLGCSPAWAVAIGAVAAKKLGNSPNTRLLQNLGLDVMYPL